MAKKSAQGQDEPVTLGPRAAQAELSGAALPLVHPSRHIPLSEPCTATEGPTPLPTGREAQRAG